MGAPDVLFLRPVHQSVEPASTRGYYANLGTQLDLRLVLFTYLNTTLSGGYAAAADRNGHISTQYMVSLRIL